MFLTKCGFRYYLFADEWQEWHPSCDSCSEYPKCKTCATNYQKIGKKYWEQDLVDKLYNSRTRKQFFNNQIRI